MSSRIGWGIALCLALAVPAGAEVPEVDAQTVVDQAQIRDLITRYYYDLGHADAESFGRFYTEDAEFVIGPVHYKGLDGIAGAYRNVGDDNPARKAWSFNVLLSNPLIVVQGDTATARLIYTEVVIDTEGAAPRILSQGREYDRFVKRDGHWRIQRRELTPPNAVPEGWAG